MGVKREVNMEKIYKYGSLPVKAIFYPFAIPIAIILFYVGEAPYNSIKEMIRGYWWDW